MHTVELAQGRHVFCSHFLMVKIGENPTDEEIAVEEDRSKSVLLLLNSDNARFGDLMKTLEDGTSLGRDEYPVTVPAMYELMATHCPDSTTSNTRRGVVLVQQATTPPSDDNSSNARNRDRTPVAGTDGNIINALCYNCNTPGHLSYNCPEPSTRDGVGMLQVGFSLAQSSSSQEVINPNWILLDTCSTDNVFRNKKFLTNVRMCETGQELNIITNGGSKLYETFGDVTFLPVAAYYNRDSLANVLSFKKVSEIPGVRITVDTAVENAILVHMKNGTTHKFHECHDGLYFMDMEKYNSNYNNSVVTAYPKNISLLSTVAQNKSMYTKEQISRAEAAVNLQELIGWPGIEFFKKLVSKNLILNCKINIDDIERSIKIYGTPEPLLQGKMTAPTQAIHNAQTTNVPAEFMDIHKHVHLYVDICYINKLAFLVTRSGNINFITMNHLKNKTKEIICKMLLKVKNLYTTRGFEISHVYADNEFEVELIRDQMQPSALHICAANEHVPKIERLIRTIKERARCICHAVPYNRYTKLMTQSLAHTVTQWLNAFPTSTGVVNDLSPANIIQGKLNPDFNRNRIHFGAYALVHSGTRNDMSSRATPCIALNESNVFDGQYFMSLESGRRINARKWKLLPIDQTVIDKVNTMGRTGKQPSMPNNVPIFEWAPGLEIDIALPDIEAIQEMNADFEHAEAMSTDFQAVISEDEDTSEDEEDSQTNGSENDMMINDSPLPFIEDSNE